MRNSTIVVIILLLVVAIGFFFLGSQFGTGMNPSMVSTTTQTGTDTGSNPVVTSPTDTSAWQVFGTALFTIRYPQIFTNTAIESTNDWRSGANGDSGTLDLSIMLPKSFEPGTNFSDAKLTVGHSVNATSVANCMKPDLSGGPASSMTTRLINGVSFTVFTSSDAGAGNLYDTTSYRVIHDKTCVAVEYTIHYTQIANYPPGTVTQFDETKVAAMLDSVVDTFTFK